MFPRGTVAKGGQGSQNGGGTKPKEAFRPKKGKAINNFSSGGGGGGETEGVQV